jgi:hypothetical protein
MVPRWINNYVLQAEWPSGYVLCAGVLCTLRQRRRRESSFEGMTHSQRQGQSQEILASRIVIFAPDELRAAWCPASLPLHSTLSLAGQAKYVADYLRRGRDASMQSCE